MHACARTSPLRKGIGGAIGFHALAGVAIWGFALEARRGNESCVLFFSLQ
jgi:hypothetical protein